MKIKGWSFKCENPFFVYFKKHYCPQCNSKLLRQKVSRIINSDSEEAKNYDFSVGDTFYVGDVEFRTRFFHCLQCNKDSETGCQLIELLDNSDVVFTIIFCDDDEMYYDPYSNAIYFDVNSGLVLGDGTSVQSAALGLAHEMGHAAQHLDGMLSGSRHEVENLNLEKYETPIAKELGEPIRSDYFDATGVMSMANSIHFITTSSERRPFWHYLFFWNWGKPKYLTIDHNLDG